MPFTPLGTTVVICENVFFSVCEAKMESLVRYPTTLAPTTGSVTVTAQCADNSHNRSGSSLSVRCTSSGSWSGPIPRCKCDAGYHAVSVNRRQICQGLILHMQHE